MPVLGCYDLLLHHEEKIMKIPNVDPERYCYLDLVDDALNRLTSYNLGMGVSIEMQYKVPGQPLRRNVHSDSDILQMFEDCHMVTQIQLYVYLLPTTALNVEFSSNTVGGNKGNLGRDNENVNDFEAPSNNESDNEVIVFDCDGASDSDGEWSAGKEVIDSSEDEVHGSSSVSGSLGGGSDIEGLSDFEEECASMGRNAEPESNREEVYVDSGMIGRPFIREPNGKVVLSQGLLFADVNEFRDVLRDFVIQEGFEIVRLKNEKARVTAICAGKDCTWRIHASPTPDGKTYKIKTYNPVHCCIRRTRNTNATVAWIAKKLYNKMREDPNMTYTSMKVELRERYGLEVPQMQLYRAKQKVSEDSKQFHAKSYTKLPIWCNLVKTTNPGSAVEVVFDIPKLNAHPIFKRLFLCFDAMKKGFVKGCRPWVGVDGCHLKGPFGGILLSAVALDGNKGMFPLAIAMVESESKDAWMFFLHNLHEVLCTVPEFQELETFTIMSDQQKGLDEAVAAIMPYARHRICCNHLLSNFKLRFPAMVLRPLFWSAAKASSHYIFQKAMDQMKAIDTDAAEWLLSKPLSSWARHTVDLATKSNNVSECFNNWLADDRKKTILSMAESVRCRLMGKLFERYEKACAWAENVTPKIRKDVDKTMQDSRICIVTSAGDDEFQVREGFSTFVVNLRARTCGCNYWNLSGLPCKHVCSAVAHKRANIERYCDAYYTRERYLLAYSEIIHPMPDLEEVIAEQEGGENACRQIEPPILRRPRGRPKRNRRRGIDEPPAGTAAARRSSMVRCDNCKQFGHNKRTCKGGPVQQNKKKRSKGVTGIDARQPTTQKSKIGEGCVAGNERFTNKVETNAGNAVNDASSQACCSQVTADAGTSHQVGSSSNFQGSSNSTRVTTFHPHTEASLPANNDGWAAV